MDQKKVCFLQSLPELPVRQPNAHKGTFGLSILLGGSKGMSGSISLAGQAALKAGSGLVRLIVPDSIIDLVAGNALEYMTFPLPSDRIGRIALKGQKKINDALQSATAVAIGPGLSRSLGLEVLVESLFYSLPQPLLLDADALNLLAQRKVFQQLSPQKLQTFKNQYFPQNNPNCFSFVKSNILKENQKFRNSQKRTETQKSIDHSKLTAFSKLANHTELTDFSELSVFPKLNNPSKSINNPIFTNYSKENNRKSQSANGQYQRILTPHPGEFARLSGIKISNDKMERLAAAHLFAQLNAPIILALKGHETIVSDGQRFFVNQTGNPGMATGGSGDVLTGIITALLAQGLNGFEAAEVGVALHGLAGDLAAHSLPMESLVAQDLIRFLPDAIDSFKKAKAENNKFEENDKYN
ncbi:MAG: ADP/ATP-dependent (S)-NAD(P)H-hydrate dehydratase [Planctomycetia bacterium]|nr:ADP/ATP-dependent (S)-NAD(P)H-hydrate dehydratase [Planctomycetia bacterium]